MNQRPESFILPHIRQMQGYIPGLQPKNREIIKLNTNENPFPPSRFVKKSIQKAISQERLHLYPEPLSRELRQAIGKDYGLLEENVMIGNGSDEILSLIFRALFKTSHQNTMASESFNQTKYKSVIFCEPSYSLYPVLAQTLAIRYETIELTENWHTNFSGLLEAVQKNKHKLVILANPNAPTSVAETRSSILSFAKKNPALTLVDEAYAPFWGDSLGDQAGSEEYPRLLVSGSFSKGYSLAGQRIGWLLGQARFIQELDKLRDSYNVNYLSQTVSLAAWQDKKTNQKRIQIICQTRQKLIKALEQLGFYTLPAQANFIFTKPPKANEQASHITYNYLSFLEKKNIIVRHFSKPVRISPYVRITIGKKNDMKKLIKATKEWVDIQQTKPRSP